MEVMDEIMSVDNIQKQEIIKIKENKKNSSDFDLYTIPNGIKGVYSIDEVVNDSNKRPTKILFCNLYKVNDTYESKQMYKSLITVEKLLESNGVPCFHDLNEVAIYTNHSVASEAKIV